LKAGTRVKLRTENAQTGVVTKLLKDGGFKVTFDATKDENGRKVPGGKFFYRKSQSEGFIFS